MHLFRQLLIAWLAVLVSAALPGVAHARATPHIDAALVTDTKAPSSGGTVKIAIRMTPERGWHGYWTNPGDSGLPVTVEWKAPDGVRFGDLRHPAPTLLDILGIASYVHEGPFSLVATASIPKGLANGTLLPITAKLNWLACSDTLCVPESASLETTLRVGDGTRDAEGAATLRRAAAALPAPLAGATYARVGRQWIITIPEASGINPAKARLYPTEDGWFQPGQAQSIALTDGSLRISVPASGSAPSGLFDGVISDGRRAYSIRAKAAPARTAPTDSTEAETLSALPASDAEQPLKVAAKNGPVPGPGETPSLTGGSNSSSSTAWLLLTSLIGAILGGMLLNLMPCVFPILSLKALGLARSGADRVEVRREGLGYVAGSVVTTSLLGAVLLGLRAAGQEIGWSFQLQSPLVVLALLLLTSAIALNLAGLFEFRLPALNIGRSKRTGPTGGFATGGLAALIATPCSGPFMAGALGAALVLPAAAALAVFAGLGLGMAMPFVALAWLPALQKRLPKPGPWMERLRKILALPMFATALALAWVLGRQTGVDGMALGIGVAVVAGAALWWAGHRQRSGAVAWPALAPIAIILGAVLVTGLPTAQPAAATDPEGSLREPFSRKRLAELRAAGTPVFVDFTADWCLTCKVNEKVAINTEPVAAAFKRHQVVMLTGDWTTGDPEITRFLVEHGRNSIPYYQYYAPGKEGRVLPQLLTADFLAQLPA